MRTKFDPARSAIDSPMRSRSRIEGLPPALRPLAMAVRRGRWATQDVAERITGRRDQLTPPARLMQHHGFGGEPTVADFQAIGEVNVHMLRSLTGLKPTDRVLDLGCGIGRAARVLARELRSPGSYDGLDVIPDAVGWCQDHYRRRTGAPFRFKHADVQNSRYNPHGRHSPAEFRFPYPDDAFDVVFAFSLFTHLLPESADHYLSEAGRVLRPGGQMLLTWFLLADAQLIAPDFDFQPTTGPASIADPSNPEAAVAYPETWLRERITTKNLSLREPIHFGSWRGMTSIPYQDIVVIGLERATGSRS
jgi:SAM-dependent methyltransferase